MQIKQEIREVVRLKKGVPFKFLFRPINRLLAIHPKIIHWNRAPAAKQAVKDWGQLIKEACKEPTHVKELVVGDATYKGTLDASGEGAGGVWLPGTKPIAPIVWRYKWPKEVKEELVTYENPRGTITNSDLEMAAELLGWLVLESMVPLRHEHVGLCLDNSSTVAWQMRGASKRSKVANRLLRILAVRMRHNRASPYLAGKRNHLGDVPSRSFGYRKAWHHKGDKQFLKFLTRCFHSQTRYHGQASGSRTPPQRKLCENY